MPRKESYSGKQKKKQLQKRRERKVGVKTDNQDVGKWKRGFYEQYSHEDNQGHSSERETTNSREIDLRRLSRDPNRYRLNFLRESREEISRRKLQSQTDKITPVLDKEREISIQEVYQPGSELDMPRRPEWKYGISKQDLEKKEEEYFSQYLFNIHEKFGDQHLSYFEHNLETWRQLWRVIEMSDIIAMVADVRHPILHFSPALCNFVTRTVNKPLILVLNKIDLVPTPLIVAWRNYFIQCFPEVHVIYFTSFPDDVREIVVAKKVRKRRPLGKRKYTTQIGPMELLKVCAKICQDKVNLSSWQEKIEEDLGMAHTEEFLDVNQPEEMDRNNPEHVNENLFKDGCLTIGFVGHPNVGKSSLMNGLIGKKVVSTSVTPGHTKYFQTYFLTKSVKLCDCPGLVFPSLIPKQMQILSGIYPIAQVQEPYTPVGYLAARIPLVQLLRLKHPNHDDDIWTAWDICEAWAEKRGFYTAKSSRPDVYRSANSILRMAVDGRLRMFMLPPGYTENEEKWIQHRETKALLSKVKNPNETFSAGDHNQIDFKTRLVDSISDLDLTETSSEESDSEEGDGDAHEGDLTLNRFSVLDLK